MSDGHTFYIAMSYAAVAIAIVGELLAVRARMRRAIELARSAPPQTIPNPTGSA